jgi:ABC-type xylose transport system permease subunit
MQLKARRQAKWLFAAVAAVMLTASSTWWVTSAFDTPHLDLLAALLVGGAGAALIGWLGLRG